MNLNSRKDLITRLRRNRKARKQFVDSHLGKGIAHQLRATRDQLGWSQGRLAEEVGMNQNAISRLESPGYGKPTITTLKRLAAAMDVGLVVHFVPFSQMIDWVSGTSRVDVGLMTSALAVSNFAAEEEAGIFDSEPPKVWEIHSSEMANTADRSVIVASKRIEVNDWKPSRPTITTDTIQSVLKMAPGSEYVLKPSGTALRTTQNG